MSSESESKAWQSVGHLSATMSSTLRQAARALEATEDRPTLRQLWSAVHELADLASDANLDHMIRRRNGLSAEHGLRLESIVAALTELRRDEVPS